MKKISSLPHLSIFISYFLLNGINGFCQNVGIGIPVPIFKLDVRNGSINTDSVYRISTFTVLSIAGTQNLFIGRNSGQSNSGSSNTFSGYQAGRSNTTGSENSFFGQGAGFSNTSGNSNVAIGTAALKNNTLGSKLVAVGDSALYSQSVDPLGNYGNTAVGHMAGFSNTIGYSNTFLGEIAGLANTTGSGNVFIGVNAGGHNTIGLSNTFVGPAAGHANVSGGNNVFLGFSAGGNNTTGVNLVMLGTFANPAVNNLTNAIAIGNSATVNASNKIRLGNSSITVIEGQVAYTFPSDGRFKTNITETVKGLDFIMKLRPIVYNFQTKKYDEFIRNDRSQAKEISDMDFTESERVRHSGFVAQEVALAAKEVGFDFNGIVMPKNDREAYGLSYSQFVVPLVKAVQELNNKIEKLEKDNSVLLKRLEILEQKKQISKSLVKDQNFK